MLKPLKKIAVLLAFVAISTIEACSPDPGFWVNDQIKAGKRNDFRELNDQLFKAIESGHEKEVELLLSADMLKSNNTSTINNIEYYLKTDDYHLKDEYYIVHKFKGNQTIKVNNNYNLDYQPVTREMYIAFFLPKSGDDQQMITVIYGKYTYGWRVASLSIDQYKVAGQTAPQLYQQARADYEKGYFSDAVNTMELASRCFRPSFVWQYTNEMEMSNFYNLTLQTANNTYHFPVIIKQVATKPVIFRISNQSITQGIFPALYYLSKIKLTDTVAIKKENIAVQKVIEQVFPGITRNKKYVLYSAFNEMPRSTKYVNSYDMMEKLQ